MASSRRAATFTAIALSSLLVPALAEAQSPRILGSSVGIEPKQFEARVVVGGDLTGRVAKVVFTLAPRCSSDPDASKYAAVPEVVASTSTPSGDNKAFTAIIPDPSGGTFGAWTVRSTALDASGAVIGRHQTVVVRGFEPRFKTLAFEVPGGKGAAGALDTSSGPASARLVVDLDHDAPITALALITSTHDNPSLGYATLPGEMANDKLVGATPWLSSRIEQVAPTSLVAHFEVPASTPAMSVSVKRMFLTDQRCRTAELAPSQPLALALKSATPRALPVDVRIDPASLAKSQLVIAFRLIGPAARKAPAPEIGGASAPLVTVNLLDGASHAIGTTVARPVPSPAVAEQRWDGESMATTPITIPSGPTALGEALKKGLVVEIDDGGKPAVPKTVLRAP